MNSQKRQSATTEFENNPKVKIMICGLKCGSLGLNLAFANRVVSSYVTHSLLIAQLTYSSDLWWNACVWVLRAFESLSLLTDCISENQAFGRVYRIGQKKQSYFQRIVVKNSIDARLLRRELDFPIAYILI